MRVRAVWSSPLASKTSAFLSFSPKRTQRYVKREKDGITKAFGKKVDDDTDLERDDKDRRQHHHHHAYQGGWVRKKGWISRHHGRLFCAECFSLCVMLLEYGSKRQTDFLCIRAHQVDNLSGRHALRSALGLVRRVRIDLTRCRWHAAGRVKARVYACIHRALIGPRD